MGGFTKIQLKDCSQENIDLQNEKLNKIGLKKDIRFYSEEDVRKEYAFYRSAGNKRSEYYPPHLFPETIDSYDEFKKYWSTEALGEAFIPPFGSLTFDCYFGRTSQTAMNKIAKYILENKEQIAETSGSYITFVERTKLSTQKKSILYKLEKPFEPEKLPKEKQHIPDIETGQFLCKSFSPEPFWVTFGKVDEPTFLKEKIYKDEIYNNIHRNKQGHAFMLMPLMTLGVEHEWFEDIINKALDMGLREHPIFMLSYLYGIRANDEENYIKELKKWYTQDEIIERFNLIFNELKQTHGYNIVRGFVWKPEKNKFVPIAGDIAKIKAHCQILTMLLKASKYNSFDSYELKPVI